ncbi:MAG: GMC family oxidoreductase [Alphaproteobacteria bacterium]|nr:GMC family oxidoreductase [Alphaproteobacteria bacterium]
MIRSGAHLPQGFDARADVCVIGSGAGGGVAAAIMAEAGREILILEEGQRVRTPQLNQREEQMYNLLYRDGGQQMTDDGGISVLQGRTLGGSTVINMSDVTEIPEAVWAHWRARYRFDRYGRADIEAAVAACRQAIAANPIQPEQLNRNARLLLEGGASLGIAGGAFEHNRVGCVGSGYCLIGCAYDAKRTVAHTWIPRALATGRALVQTDARVERLEHDHRRIVAAHGHLLDPVRQTPLAPFTVRADRYVLAAGAIHSPLVLLASGVGNAHVGRNLTLQPQGAALAVFDHEVIHFRGIPQGAYLDGYESITEEHGLAGFRLESVSATPGMAAATLTAWGDDMARFMAMTRRSGACLCLVPDRPNGRVLRGRDGRPRIRYHYAKDWADTFRAATRTAAEVYLAAGAEAVHLPFVGLPPVHSVSDLSRLERMPVRACSVSLISAHPQGTCRAGPDGAHGVVDNDLFVHGLDNLQVLDASVFPTSAASHTMLPVMTMAWLGAHERL